MTKESMDYPIFSALVNEAHGVVDDAMAAFVPEENEDTKAVWAQVASLLEKHVAGLEAQSEIENAIIEHERAAAWLAYKNGIRVVLQLQEEMKKIASERPAY